MRIHVLAIGQSNIANHGNAQFDSSFGTVWHQGQQHPVRDPIPGASGHGGSVWAPVADCLRNRAASFELTNIARGGSSITQWATEFQPAIHEAIDMCRSAGSVPSHVVFHQGEKDTLLATTGPEYLDRLCSVFDAVGQLVPDARWVVCRASYRFGQTNSDVIDAQTQFAKRTTAVLEGPNTDLLGTDFRHDDTHFNALGLTRFGHDLGRSILNSAFSN